MASSEVDNRPEQPEIEGPAGDAANGQTKLRFETLFQAAGLGVLAGMRSMSAPAVLSAHLADRPDPAPAGTPLRLFNSPLVSRVIRLMAWGEVAVDKLPGIPPRTGAAPLAVRCLSGGAVGAVVAVMDRRPVWAGALAGAGMAAFSTHLFYRLRRQAGEKSGAPDAVWAVTEDVLVIAGSVLMRRVLDHRPGNGINLPAA